MDVTICGNMTIDQFMGPLAAMPAWGTEVVVRDCHERTGGAISNTAFALAALGARVSLLSAVGNDQRGQGMLRELRGAGVDVSGVVVDPERPTSLGLCLIREDGERGFATHLGALEGLTEDILWQHASSLRGHLCFLNGYWLTPGFTPERTAAVLQHLREQGTPTALDSGWDPEGWPGPKRDAFLKMLAQVDIFLPNELEAEALTGYREPLDMVRALADRGPGLVVVKLGPQGAAFGQGGEVGLVSTRPRQFADTTGAGDIFDAGFLYGCLQGWPLERSIRFGHATAALVLGTGRRGFPVQDILAEMASQEGSGSQEAGVAR